MEVIEKHFYVAAILIAIGSAFASCKNISDTETPPQETFKQPVTQPLTFSTPKKIDWDAIKSVPVHPLVKKFDISKLPVEPYDTSEFRPFKYPVEETKIDLNSLPEKDLDIDKLPSKPLKFKTYKLPPPELIRSAPIRLVDTNRFIYELGEAQGLKGTMFSCLLNDHNGFLWIGTDKGIYRYNGESVSLYVKVPANNYVLKMLEDPEGRIWITIQNGGLQILDVAAGTIKKIDADVTSGSMNTYDMLPDEQQRIWISTFSPGGLCIIDPKTSTVKVIDKAKYLLGTTSCEGLAQDNKNKVWIATYDGLIIIDKANKKIKYLNKTHGLGSDMIDQLLVDKAGKLCIGFHGGVLGLLDVHNGALQYIREGQFTDNTNHTDIFGLIQDNKGRIWLATDPNGLEVIDPVARVAKNLNKSSGLKSNEISTVMQDTRGNMWIGCQNGFNMITDDKTVRNHIGNAPTTTVVEDHNGLIWQASFYKGVNVIDRKSKIVKIFDRSHGLSGDTMNNIREINNEMFVCSNGGLDIIDPPRNTLTHLDNKRGLNLSTITSIAVDKNAGIWVCSFDKGIDIYDPRSHTLKHIGKIQGLSNGDVSDIASDKKGNIWVATLTGGVYVIDPASWSMTHLNNAAAGLQEVDQTVLLPDETGNMWIGTAAGIYIADVKNKTLTAFSRLQGLIDDPVISLLKHGNSIYVGTAKGISVLTPPADGLNGKKIWQVNSYNLSKLELGYVTDCITRDGLYWWGDHGLTVLDLAKQDTLIPPAFITGISIMDEPWYFTGSNSSGSNSGSWNSVTGPYNMPDNLQLAHHQNYFRFSYGSQNLTTHDTTWYRYKLAGADTGWSAKTTSISSRNYFSLAPGKYTFEVITKSNENAWCKPAILSFTINPPWWRTWWAYVLYVVLLGGSIWSFSHYRSLQLIKDKRVLEHKVHIRTEEVLQQKEEIEAQRDNLEKAFGELKTTQTQLVQSEKMASLGELTAGIAHEIQNPLNFVNNFSEVNSEMIDELKEELKSGNINEALAIAADIKENEQKINHHGKRADAIVKGMLQHSRTGTNTKEPTDINKLADEYIRLSYHGLRAKDKSFNAEMLTHFDLQLPPINVIPQDIGRVMLNLFNNAFYAVNEKRKTAGPDYMPTVEITTATQSPPAGEIAQSILIIVRDNGVGIPDAIKEKIMQPFFTTKPTGEGTGLGLSLTYDMVVKGHGGKIDINTKEGEFTAFTIQLPVS